MKLIRSEEKLKDKGREFVVSREKTPSRILENVNENLNCEPVARSFPSTCTRCARRRNGTPVLVLPY